MREIGTHVPVLGFGPLFLVFSRSQWFAWRSRISRFEKLPARAIARSKARPTRITAAMLLIMDQHARRIWPLQVVMQLAVFPPLWVMKYTCTAPACELNQHEHYSFMAAELDVSATNSNHIAHEWHQA